MPRRAPLVPVASAPSLSPVPVRLAVLVVLLSATAHAQGARLAAADGPLYEVVERLQRRGHLLGLNPTVAPYSHAELDRALAALDTAALGPVERRWAAWLRRAVPRAADGPTARVEVGGGTIGTNNERLETWRWTDAEDAVVQAGPINVYPNLALRASIADGPWAVQLGARVDVFYEDDPDGLDVVNRSIFLRNQESVVGVETRRAALHVGNPARHWGLPSGEGLFVSGNPRPYPALMVRLGGERLSVRSLAAQLDAATADGRFTGRAGDTPRETALRRFLYAHRIDWRPRPWLAVIGMESMLTSGPGASLSLPAMAPLAVLSFLNDTPPVDDANNGIVGGMLWLQRGPVTVAGQLAMDDLDLFNRAEPLSVALTGQTVVAGLAGGRVDAGLDLTLVTARTYSTQLPENNYVYALRGLGTQFSDFVHLRAGADVYLDDRVPGLALRPEFHALWQGEGDLREPFLPNDAPAILVGDAERTLRAGLRASYSPTPATWLRADVGVNATANDGWIRGRDAVRFVGLVEGGVRIALGARVPEL